MFESLHQYICPHCRIPIVGKSLHQLCFNLNDHNDQRHPGDTSHWTPISVRCSTHYVEPDDEENLENDVKDEAPLPGLTAPDPTFGTPMPQYCEPYGTCKNSAIDPDFPRLTRDDLDFLKSKMVKWR